jgi:hypothetical protein
MIFWGFVEFGKYCLEIFIQIHFFSGAKGAGRLSFLNTSI